MLRHLTSLLTFEQVQDGDSHFHGVLCRLFLFFLFVGDLLKLLLLRKLGCIGRKRALLLELKLLLCLCLGHIILFHLKLCLLPFVELLEV